MVLLAEIVVVKGDEVSGVVCCKVDYEGMVVDFAHYYFQSLIDVLYLMNDLYLSLGQ